MWAWPTLPRVSRAYIISCPATAETHLTYELGFPPLSACAAIVAYSIPPAGVHRRTGEGELGFWEALCATAQVLHHGSPSVQVGRCCLPSSSTPSTSTRRQQRCHQQRYCCDVICYTATATSTRSVRATYLDLFSDGCCTVCPATIHVD